MSLLLGSGDWSLGLWGFRVQDVNYFDFSSAQRLALQRRDLHEPPSLLLNMPPLPTSHIAPSSSPLLETGGKGDSEPLTVMSNAPPTPGTTY